MLLLCCCCCCFLMQVNNINLINTNIRKYQGNANQNKISLTFVLD